MKELKNRRVLVIDDNPAIHDDFRKILGGSSSFVKELGKAEATIFGDDSKDHDVDGFEMDSAFQGREGLACVQQALASRRPFAMAFIDVRMPPGWDGIETIAHLWQVDPDLQIVICTAYSDYSLTDMIARIGESDRFVILKKPFDTIEASQLAHSLTSKWHLLQQTKQKVNDLEKLVRERTTELTAINQTLLTEIDERKRAESGHRIMEVQLRQAQKLEAIGQLAAGIAHEINTPMQYIGDNTRFLKDAFKNIIKVLQCHAELLAAVRTMVPRPDFLDRAEEVFAAGDLTYLFEQIPSCLHDTLEGVERVNNIVRAMKEFSHPDNKDKVAGDLNRAIQTTVTVAQSQWKHVAEVKLNLDAALPQVPCFMGEFNQCILNLLVNAAHAIGDAVKHQPGAKGLITVSTRLEGDHVEICLNDTGTGIPESARPHIFEPFFTTKEVGRGTGQGLSIVYGSIVKKHGGTVSFKTECGKGTTFVLCLPLKSQR
jgi:signal transduction histidine kinase